MSEPVSPSDAASLIEMNAILESAKEAALAALSEIVGTPLAAPVTARNGENAPLPEAGEGGEVPPSPVAPGDDDSEPPSSPRGAKICGRNSSLLPLVAAEKIEATEIINGIGDHASENSSPTLTKPTCIEQANNPTSVIEAEASPTNTKEKTNFLGSPSSGSPNSGNDSLKGKAFHEKPAKPLASAPLEAGLGEGEALPLEPVKRGDNRLELIMPIAIGKDIVQNCKERAQLSGMKNPPHSVAPASAKVASSTTVTTANGSMSSSKAPSPRRSGRKRASNTVVVDGHVIKMSDDYVVTGDNYRFGAIEPNPTKPKKPRGRPRKVAVATDQGHPTKPKKPRGRPRKVAVATDQGDPIKPKKPRGRPRKVAVATNQGDPTKPKNTRGRPRKVAVASDQGGPTKPKNPRGRPRKVVVATNGGQPREEGEASVARYEKPIAAERGRIRPSTPKRPALEAGADVYAAHWPPDDTARDSDPSWSPGVVSSCRTSTFPTDERYGRVRYYDVRLYDGEVLEGVPDHFVFCEEEYLLRRIHDANKNLSWMGAVRNVRDETSNDRWARCVGWFVIGVGGGERAFSTLSEALRVYDDDGAVRSEGAAAPTEDDSKRERQMNIEASDSGGEQRKWAGTPTSSVKGVYKLASGKWKVDFKHEGMRVSLQSSFTQEQALLVYCALRGELEPTVGLKLPADEIESNVKLAKEAALRALSEFKGSKADMLDALKNRAMPYLVNNKKDSSLSGKAEGVSQRTRAMCDSSECMFEANSIGDEPRRKPSSQSEVTGVYAVKTGKWKVDVAYKGKRLYLQLFTRKQALLVNQVARGMLEATRDSKLTANQIDSNLRLAKEAALRALSEFEGELKTDAPDLPRSKDKLMKRDTAPLEDCKKWSSHSGMGVAIATTMAEDASHTQRKRTLSELVKDQYGGSSDGSVANSELAERSTSLGHHKKKPSFQSRVAGVIPTKSGKCMQSVGIGYKGQILQKRSFNLEQAVLFNPVASGKLETTKNSKLSDEEIRSNPKLAREVVLGALSEIGDVSNTDPSNPLSDNGNVTTQAEKSCGMTRSNTACKSWGAQETVAQPFNAKDVKPSANKEKRRKGRWPKNIDFRTRGVRNISSGKWSVYFHYMGKQRNFGTYPTQEQAASVNKIVRRKLKPKKGERWALTDEEIQRNVEEVKSAVSIAVRGDVRNARIVGVCQKRGMWDVEFISKGKRFTFHRFGTKEQAVLVNEVARGIVRASEIFCQQMLKIAAEVAAVAAQREEGVSREAHTIRGEIGIGQRQHAHTLS